MTTTPKLTTGVRVKFNAPDSRLRGTVKRLDRLSGGKGLVAIVRWDTGDVAAHHESEVQPYQPNFVKTKSGNTRKFKTHGEAVSAALILGGRVSSSERNSAGVVYGYNYYVELLTD